MLNRIIQAFAVTAAFAALPATAQDSGEQEKVGSRTNWSIFVNEDPKQCWIVSAPEKTENTRDGRAVSVRRGDILLFTTYRPGDNVSGEISFTGGYPFAEGSFVTLEVGDAKFEFFTQGEWAWPADPADDAKIIASLKRGTDATLSARSSRGTSTKDTFSLLGFTDALADAETRCGS